MFDESFKRAWLYSLLIALSVWVLWRWNFLFEHPTAVDAGILIVYVALLLFPLFSEIALFGVVKLRHRVEEVKNELTGEIREIRNVIAVRNNNNINFGADFLPSAVRRDIEQGAPDSVRGVSDADFFDLRRPDEPLAPGVEGADLNYLVSVRVKLERAVNELVDATGKITRSGFGRKLDLLQRLEIINSNIAAAADWVYRSCSPAVHGDTEIPRTVVDEVREIAKPLVYQLRDVLPQVKARNRNFV